MLPESSGNIAATGRRKACWRQGQAGRAKGRGERARELTCRDTDAPRAFAAEGVSLLEESDSTFWRKKGRNAESRRKGVDVTEDDGELEMGIVVVEKMRANAESDTQPKKEGFWGGFKSRDLPRETSTFWGEGRREFAFVRRKRADHLWKGKTVHIPR